MFRFLLSLVAVSLLAAAVPAAVQAADFVVFNADGSVTRVRSFGARTVTVLPSSYTLSSYSSGTFGVRAVPVRSFGVVALDNPYPHCQQPAPQAFSFGSRVFFVP